MKEYGGIPRNDRKVYGIVIRGLWQASYSVSKFSKINFMQPRTLFYGEGVFETILWRGRTKKLMRHYERLKTSAEFFHIPYPDFEHFCRKIEEKTENKINLYVKFCLFSKGEGPFYAMPEESEILVITKEYNSTKKLKNFVYQILKDIAQILLFIIKQ